jgi:hypothetical protein
MTRSARMRLAIAAISAAITILIGSPPAHARTYPWYSPELISCRDAHPFRPGYDLPYPGRCRFVGRPAFQHHRKD